MKIGRVIGNIVSTIKTPSHANQKLMIVEPIDTYGNAIGGSVVAVDAARAGVGDFVLILEEGGSARDIMNNPEGAVDAIIVGVLDNLDITN